MLRSRFGLLSAMGTLLLAACGGGGDSGSGNPTAYSPEGAYGGTLSGSPIGANAQNMLVLENNQAWTLYGTLGSDGVFYGQGFVQGNGAVSGTNFSSSDARDYSAYNGLVGTPATVTGSFSQGVSISGSITYSNATVTFSGTTANVAPLFTYNTPAQLSAVTGNWQFYGEDGQPATATVSADGSFSTTSATCTTSGTIKPRASGKNVFDLAVTTGARCLTPNTAFTGIGLNWASTTGQRQLLIAAVNGDRSRGMVAAMAR